MKTKSLRHNVLLGSHLILCVAFISGIQLYAADAGKTTASGAKGGAAAKVSPPRRELTPEEKQFNEARTSALRDAGAADAKSSADYAIVLEKAARALEKDYASNPQVLDMLVQAAGYSEPDKARALAKEVLGKNPSERAKTRAEELVQKLDRVGKPLAIKFTAVDGRAVDLAKMKGKVVLVDFWATWCGPCVVEVPNVVKAYEKLHPRGFEIVGISFDQENAKEKLQKFVTDKKMPWPQYFDGKGWNNDFGRQFGIYSIPAMWLVDKQGNLRDLNARANLDQKVEKLLAE